MTPNNLPKWQWWLSIMICGVFLKKKINKCPNYFLQDTEREKSRSRWFLCDNSMCVCVWMLFFYWKNFCFREPKKKNSNESVWWWVPHIKHWNIFVFPSVSASIWSSCLFVCVVVITQEKRKKIPIWYIDRYMIVVFGHHCHIYIYAHTHLSQLIKRTHTHT